MLSNSGTIDPSKCVVLEAGSHLWNHCTLLKFQKSIYTPLTVEASVTSRCKIIFCWSHWGMKKKLVYNTLCSCHNIIAAFQFSWDMKKENLAIILFYIIIFSCLQKIGMLQCIIIARVNWKIWLSQIVLCIFQVFLGSLFSFCCCCLTKKTIFLSFF